MNAVLGPHRVHFGEHGEVEADNVSSCRHDRLQHYEAISSRGCVSIRWRRRDRIHPHRQLPTAAHHAVSQNVVPPVSHHCLGVVSASLSSEKLCTLILKRDLQGQTLMHSSAPRIRVVLVEVVWFSLGAGLEDGRRKLEELLTPLSHIGEARESRAHKVGACAKSWHVASPLEMD